MTIKVFTSGYFGSLTSEASQSSRLRSHRNIHESYTEPCQRLFNAIGVDSYIRPHRHLLDRKPEFLIAIKGKFVFIEFDTVGNIQSVMRFGTEKYAQDEDMIMGLEISSGIWHTVLAEMPGSILLEVKSGPFVPSDSKEYADWSPREGSKESKEYLLYLRLQFLKFI